jgi:hypothetical protein
MQIVLLVLLDITEKQEALIQPLVHQVLIDQQLEEQQLVAALIDQQEKRAHLQELPMLTQLYHVIMDIFVLKRVSILMLILVRLANFRTRQTIL